MDFAQLYLARVKKAAETSTAKFRVHTAKDLLSIVAGILEGEIQRTGGDLAAAIATFQRAADLQDALVYDEPEPLPFAAHHWLGAALLEGGRFADAEKVYRADLKEHPRNGWSLLGLQQALAGLEDSVATGRCRSRGELGSRRHLDPVVAILTQLLAAQREPVHDSVGSCRTAISF